MSTESERIRSCSDAVDGVNASRSEVGNDHVSETLADPLTSQAEELVATRDTEERESCVTVDVGCSSLAAADDQGMEKRNGFSDLERQTESVSEGLDLGIGTHNAGVETNESEKKCPVGNVEKEVEPDVACSRGANLGDVKGSDGRLDCEDLGEDRDSGDSKNQEKRAENLDAEFSAALESDECKDESVLDDVNPPVTAKLNLSDSDLVWAKVRSHPWWPGQVFDPSSATEKAKKYFKKGSFLVTYFGDCTFAWNDASRIKPFRQHFTQMEKQSTLSDFRDAIECALEEVSRRIEFGLACPCISEEAYEKIKTQNIINSGIREESCRKHGGDKVSSAVSLEPANLLEYVKSLACSPRYDTTDNLQLVCQKARLLAFYRWKGFTDLPEFETLVGSVESAPKASPTKKKNNAFKEKVSIPETNPTEQLYSKRRKTEDQDDCRHDGVFEYEDTTALVEKEMTLAEFIAEKRLSRSNKNRSHENSSTKQHCEKKHKVAHSELPKSSKRIKPNLQTDDPGSANSVKKDRKDKLSAGDTVTPQKVRPGFGIGASILRVANQMHCSTPTRLIHCSNSSTKMASRNNGRPNSNQTRPKAKDLVQDTKEAPCTKLPEDSKSGTAKMSQTRNLKDSSKEQMLHDDRKEAATIADEIPNKDSNLTLQKITDSDFKDQPSNKNCSESSDDSKRSFKKDISAE